MEIGGVEPLSSFAGDERRAPGAGVVAGSGPLDLDDVGPEIGERLPRPRSSEYTCEFEDF
jgi:hypothetical protein